MGLPSSFILNAGGEMLQRAPRIQDWMQKSNLSHRILRAIEQQDYGWMNRIHAWPAPRWLRIWMTAATRAGDGGLWGLLGILVLLFGGSGRGTAIAAAASASAAGVALFVSVKRMVRRRRPCDIRPHCWANLRSPDPYSFPSGHTLTAFAVTIPFLLYSPMLGLVLLFCSFSIAASRIVLGMHFLSDVLMGALFGCGLGYASVLLLMR